MSEKFRMAVMIPRVWKVTRLRYDAAASRALVRCSLTANELALAELGITALEPPTSSILNFTKQLWTSSDGVHFPFLQSQELENTDFVIRAQQQPCLTMISCKIRMRGTASYIQRYTIPANSVSYDFEYEEDDDDQDTGDVDIENKYYNAKQMKINDPQGAIEEFLGVPGLEKEKGDWGFKGLKQAIKLEFKLGLYEKVRASASVLTFDIC